ncbi:MAG: hypothetical protein IKK46_04110 [Clostridia bacterium]|nr:hypothetical protein [Clostridia bacterium]
MAEYSYNEIMKMQNDAIKRVNEMQKRAKTVVDEMNEEKEQYHSPPTKQNFPQNVNRVKMPNDYLDELKNFASTSSHFEESETEQNTHRDYKETQSKKQTPKQHSTQKDNVKSILNDLNLDSDKALILSLILLLTEEKADEMLILSLLYILS